MNTQSPSKHAGGVGAAALTFFNKDIKLDMLTVKPIVKLHNYVKRRSFRILVGIIGMGTIGGAVHAHRSLLRKRDSWKAVSIRYDEYFELCEYGRMLGAGKLDELLLA